MTVVPFDPLFQDKIAQMMDNIQSEYLEAITSNHSTVIKDVYKDPDQKFWIAIHQDQEVAGTVGVKLSNNFAEIKRMFVDPAFRGPVFPTAKLLLKTAIDHAASLGFKKIYLGTMSQFVAAQRFYEKSGFTKIGQQMLPRDYKLNPMDSIFYRMDL
jgi:N-acetylglutamate synthase-like GNAT family acetyltransferase